MDTFTPSQAPLVNIKAVQFGLLSPADIKAQSVVEVYHAETFEKGERKANGLVDKRMGCVENTKRRCDTCSLKKEECPGHFGHIELAHPVYHAGYLGRIKKLLEIFCYHCSRLRVRFAPPTPNGPSRFQKFMRTPKGRRFAEAWDYGKTRTVCERRECGRQLLPIRKAGLTLTIDGGKEKTVLDPEQVLKIFSAISDEEYRLLGLDPILSRPEWMIQSVIPVPPPSVRPSLNMDTCGRAEDDLTHKLGDIIKHNNIAKDPATTAKNQVESRELVHYHAATYLDNHISGVQTSLLKSRPLKSLKSRLKGKEGRLRNNLNGKRVEQSARTVITGDPNISIDEVGVPYSIAKNLTFTETVTPWNKDDLQRVVANGRDVYPGANYVIVKNRQWDLRYAGKRLPELEVGDKVKRHLVNGDVVIFNRQPSLHKMSMMGHRVRVMPYSTFRLNLSCTTPYNADFDGDEMNLHVPQNWVARSEIETLAMVPSMIVSPQSNKPVCGIVQDALLGSYLLTQRDAFLTYEEASALVTHISDHMQERSRALLPSPAILRPAPLWTGKQLFSLLLPPTLEYTGFHSAHPTEESGYSSPGDSRVIITDGEVVCGILCKRTLGTSGGGLIHLLWQDYGLHVVQSFMDGCQQLANNWLYHNGFSVGIGDATISVKGREDIKRVVEDANGEDGDDEGGITKALTQARDTAGKIAQRSLVWKNNFQSMVTGGSKGSSINISQITACVGQQNVEGNRIPFMFEERSLPHFQRFDNSPAARGFVRHSYYQGLSPTEFFFHAMGGREGLIDTAVKTAETGYIQRRLVKALEDVRVAYDGTVRNGSGQIIQFAYGEDGLDATAIEKQTLVSISQSDDELRRKFSDDPDELQQLMEDRDALGAIFPGMDDSVALPVNLKRRLLFATNRYPSKHEADFAVNTYRRLKDLEERWKTGFVGTRSNVELFCMHMRSVLASKRLRSHRTSEEAFTWLLDEIEKKYALALVDPGTMVGVLAAQSIGEPATQMTLNTFHLAGISSKKVTLGIPRLKELIDNARTMKSPSMTLHLTPEFMNDVPERLESKLRQLKAAIEHVTLRDVVEDSEIVYDPDPYATTIEADKGWLSLLMSIPDDNRPDPDTLSRWVMRVVVNRQKMWSHCMGLSQIGDALQKTLAEDGWVVWSDDNDNALVMHVRLFDEDSKSVPMDAYFAQIKDSLFASVTLKGIRDITSAEAEQVVVRSIGGNGLAKETVIETAGINMADVCEIEGIDPTRMTCNSPREVLDFLGVEAARATLFAEIRKVIQYDGSYINAHHLSVHCDAMTRDGLILSATRHGLNRQISSPFTKASFEETCDILLNAAMDSERDDLTGISPSLILGQYPRAGTGMFDLVLDESKLHPPIVEESVEFEQFNWADDV